MKIENFIDEAIIKIKAGNGGDGASMFHREKYVEHGGPSGGNGGDGGSIFFIGDVNENTLLNFKAKRIYRAKNGGNGARQNKTGARGESLYIKVPLGTEIIVDDKKHTIIFDQQIILIQQGGKGGRGNASFKSSKNIAPTLFEKGEKIGEIEIKLNLKVLADVGILGFPNIGKSTFISKISNARPKISNYEFTTLTPKLGLVQFRDKRFIITDLPGIIKDASKGKGMGNKFLKHLSRTKLILHFVNDEELNYFTKYQTLRKELKNYSKEIYNLPEIIVITKSDTMDHEIKKMISNQFSGKELFFISSHTNNGINELLDKVVVELNKINNKVKIEDKRENVKITLEQENPLEDLKIVFDGIDTWELSGKYVKYWGNRIPLISYENYHRILLKLKAKQIIKQLLDQGLKAGQYIKIKDTEFIIKFEHQI